MKILSLLYIICFFLNLSYSQSSFPKTSVLADGQIFKFSILESGVYKINKSLLDKAGISNVNPLHIKVYAFPGGQIEETIQADNIINDLYELPVEVIGGNDGSFDSNDEIYFYAEGPSVWRFDNSLKKWSFQKNIYDTKAYIYIKVDNSPSKKISEISYNVLPEISSSTYELKQNFEEDKINLLTLTINTQGSGQQWFGDNFKSLENRPIPNLDLSKYLSSENIGVQALFATRSPVSSTVELSIGSEKFSRNTSGVFINSIETNFAALAQFDLQVRPTSINEGVRISLKNSSATGDGWVDYIRTIGYVQATYTGDQLFVSDRNMINKSGRITFQSGTFDLKAWKIKDFKTYEALTLNNNEVFVPKSDSLTEFILFHRNGVKTPEFIEKLPNQNLHNSDGGDWVVIYPDTLREHAIKLANLRQNKLKVAAYSLENILDEFGGGRKDPSALRNFNRMLYERNPDFKYLLLMGDATYDARNIQNENAEHLHIPVYQTKNSLHPVLAFPSDDYYGLLTNGEGGDLIGSLEVAVGRLPVRNIAEANSIVNKIIEYETNPNRFGPWRSNVILSADDEDGNLHLIQADRLAQRIEQSTPEYLIKKKYLDAYGQISTPAGQRYPDVNFEINNEMSSGALAFCYLGHGGPSGLAEERIVQVSDILSWHNTPNLPIMITATCSFTGFDNPKNVSAGEYAILSNKGGAIALFSTVRAVYASENERITNSVFNFLLPTKRDKPKTLGDIFLSAKNFQRFDTISANTRKFGLFGDPGQIIVVPQYNLSLDSINGNDLKVFSDTVSAFDKVRLSGSVKDENFNLKSDFSGRIFITVFDKPTKVTTLVNDVGNSNNFTFDQFRNIIFKGQATVQNGKWETQFIVPSDINYTIGDGKILLYAHSDNEDAIGSFNQLKIGGEPNNVIEDDNPPIMDLFINDQNFKNGGITNAQPTLIANISDDIGIKVTGTSIGHDLTAKLEGEINGTYILNDFFIGTLNDPTSGTVRFQLPTLLPGKYKITVKAWDLGNNSVEKFIEFEVIDPEVVFTIPTFNYPNPFLTSTSIVFEHDFNNQEIELEIQIFDFTGKLIRVIKENKITQASADEIVQWDGNDNLGQSLPKGMYIYKIKLKSLTLSSSRESDYRNILKL
jgi:hypothetical protein